jgi:hypothetical protein
MTNWPTTDWHLCCPLPESRSRDFVRNMLQSVPENIFQTDARLAMINDNRALGDQGGLISESQFTMHWATLSRIIEL